MTEFFFAVSPSVGSWSILCRGSSSAAEMLLKMGITGMYHNGFTSGKKFECKKHLKYFIQGSTSVRAGGTVPWPPPSDPENKKMYKQYSAVYTASIRQCIPKCLALGE